MGDRGEGTEYSEIQVSGQANVHAGQAINANYYIGNLYLCGQGVNLQQIFGNPSGLLSQPQNAAAVENETSLNYSDSTIVTSPSQSSDSTNFEDRDESNMTTRSRLAYRVLEQPTAADQRYKYFLEGSGLARHVVQRQLGFMAGPNAEFHRVTYKRRDGFFVIGKVLDDEQLAELRRLSREYERHQRVERHVRQRFE